MPLKDGLAFQVSDGAFVNISDENTLVWG